MNRDPRSILPLNPRAFYILVSLAQEPAHGYAIGKAVEAATDGTVRFTAGTLYPLIRQMLADGLIAESSAFDEDPRRRTYRLTPGGRRSRKPRRSGSFKRFGWRNPATCCRSSSRLIAMLRSLAALLIYAYPREFRQEYRRTGARTLRRRLHRLAHRAENRCADAAKRLACAPKISGATSPFAVRVLRKAPLFTAVVVGTLGRNRLQTG